MVNIILRIPINSSFCKKVINRLRGEDGNSDVNICVGLRVQDLSIETGVTGGRRKVIIGDNKHNEQPGNATKQGNTITYKAVPAVAWGSDDMF